MRQSFLKFMEQVMSIDCPFYNFIVSTYKNFIEVNFIIITSIRPEELGWLNTHLIGGRWFLIAKDDSIRLIVRFEEDNDD